MQYVKSRISKYTKRTQKIPYFDWQDILLIFSVKVCVCVCVCVYVCVNQEIFVVLIHEFGCQGI